jgi:hypothetical protein
MAVRHLPSRNTRSGVRATRWLSGLALAASLACQRERGAELLGVSAVLPGEVQFGDALQIVGEGFGLGSPATVTFRGEVFRAGRPSEPVELSLRALTESQRELTLDLPRSAERAFCGDPEGASHATFRGDVEVAIAARAAGAPPATGRLHGVAIELYPAVKTQGAEHRLTSLGRDVLTFLGVEVAVASEGGLEVLHVVPDGRAAAADWRPGDRLVRAAGLSVLSPSDLVPPAARELSVALVRANVEHTTRVDVDGFIPRPEPALGWAALPIFVAALWFVGAASPLSRWFGWAVQNWVEQRRARARALRKGAGSGSRAYDGPSTFELMGGASGVLVWIGMASALSAPLLRRVPVDVSLGLSLCLFVSSAVLSALAFIGAGGHDQRWSLRRGSSAALSRWVVTLPAWLALVAASFQDGIDVGAATSSRGPLPWHWSAFRDPTLFIACLALLASALPRAGRPLFRLSHARPPRLSWRLDGDEWFERLQLCTVCALATHLFLGGDALPLAGQDDITPLVLALSALLLVAKYTLLVLGVSFLRGLCLGLTPAEWSRLTLRFGLPISLGALALGHIWRSLGAMSPFWSWVWLGFGPACVAATAFGLVVSHRRALCAAREPSPPSLSPWL